MCLAYYSIEWENETAWATFLFFFHFLFCTPLSFVRFLSVSIDWITRRERARHTHTHTRIPRFMSLYYSFSPLFSKHHFGRIVSHYHRRSQQWKGTIGEIIPVCMCHTLNTTLLYYAHEEKKRLFCFVFLFFLNLLTKLCFPFPLICLFVFQLAFLLA